VTIIEPSVTLEWATPEAAKMLERAARTCYKSERLECTTAAETDAFIKRVALQNGHESVIEHVVISTRWVIDRGISHELVRHRLAAFSQESTRYVNYTKDAHGAGDIQFILPLGLTEKQRDFALWAYRLEQDIYNGAIELGMSPQQARDFLPNGVKTELVFTVNAREARHVLRLRTSQAAHPKMRAAAKQFGYLCAEWLPCLFEPWAKP
jgi:thymidylate synthase (FAD)